MPGCLEVSSGPYAANENRMSQYIVGVMIRSDTVTTAYNAGFS